MALTNTKEKFGSITKLLHWSIFLLFIAQYFLVYRREYIPEGTPENVQYILLHKSTGIIVLVLGTIMILWSFLGQRPPLPGNTPLHEKILAKTVHFLLYVSMLFMPITGICMTYLSGRSLLFFGYELPKLLETNKPLAGTFHTIHVWASFIIIGLFVLHAGAALFHHFIRKDNILNRMRPFK